MNPLTLADAPLGRPFVVRSLSCPENAPNWRQWLEEIGFMPGEQVVLMVRRRHPASPMVVRVGASSFALRRAEAACVLLDPVESRTPPP